MNKSTLYWFDFNMSPKDVIRGHEIAGEKPLWFPREAKRHLWCTVSDCSDCFLDSEISAKIIRIDKKLGVKKDDITIILQEIGAEMTAQSRTRLGNFFRHYLKMPNVKFNREYEVCHRHIIIRQRNLSLLMN